MIAGTFGMHAFDAYKLYLALKSHFTRDSYDFFKYNGSVKASPVSFEKRHNKYFFTKLAKHKDLLNFLTANMVYGDPKVWVGDILNGERSSSLYREFMRIRDSLTYVFTQDLEKLDDDVLTNITVMEGQHPPLLRLALRGDIHIETFIILNDLWRFAPKWNQTMEDVVWCDFYTKCKKYKPFLNYDREKFMQLALDRFRK